MINNIPFFNNKDKSSLIAIGAYDFKVSEVFSDRKLKLIQFHFNGFGRPGYITIFKSSNVYESILIRIESDSEIGFLKEIYDDAELVPCIVRWVSTTKGNWYCVFLGNSKSIRLIQNLSWMKREKYQTTQSVLELEMKISEKHIKQKEQLKPIQVKYNSLLPIYESF